MSGGCVHLTTWLGNTLSNRNRHNAIRNESLLVQPPRQVRSRVRDGAPDLRLERHLFSSEDDLTPNTCIHRDRTQIRHEKGVACQQELHKHGDTRCGSSRSGNSITSYVGFFCRRFRASGAGKQAGLIMQAELSWLQRCLGAVL